MLCIPTSIVNYFFTWGGRGKGGRGVSKHRRKKEGQGKRGWKTEVSETIVNKEEKGYR
jgi:hypothetical protein